MAHHKRGKAKNARTGWCKLCKAHKANGVKNLDESQPLREQKARESDRKRRREADDGL
jgi:hypothetical protein